MYHILFSQGNPPAQRRSKQEGVGHRSRGIASHNQHQRQDPRYDHADAVSLLPIRRVPLQQKERFEQV